MSKYRVKVKSFINNAIREVGTIIEYAGHAHPSNLEPVEKDAKDTVVSAAKDDKQDLQRMGEAAKGVDLNAEKLTA